jgi:ABC-type transporter Mla subunit MlaD
MMRCRAPALITLPALLGLLHTAALADAEPPPEVTPRTGRGPTAPDVDLKATLDELTARVQQLSQRAGATAELAETVMGATQRLAQFEEAAAAEAIAVRQLLAATRDRIADLDAARAKDGAILARLQAELDAARAESERLEASRRGLEELFQFYKEAMDAALGGGPAAAVADLPRVAAAPAEEGGPGACDGSVEVESGDTLDAIARRCKTTVDALMKANPDIKDPRRILVGQKIALPVS